MKAILDTNVFISGVFFGGPPHRILQAWSEGDLTLVVSPHILDEYKEVGERLAAQFPEVDLEPFLLLLALEAEISESVAFPEPVCDDPDDDVFLACAVASGCRTIVSGDRALLRTSGYQGIQVVSPRRFVDNHLS